MSIRFLVWCVSFFILVDKLTAPDPRQKEHGNASAESIGESLIRSIGESFLESSFDEMGDSIVHSNLCNDKTLNSTAGHLLDDELDTLGTIYQDSVQNSALFPLTSTPLKTRSAIQTNEDESSIISETSNWSLDISGISTIEGYGGSVVYDDDHILSQDVHRSHNNKGKLLTRKLYKKAMLSTAVAKLKIRKCRKCCFPEVTIDLIKNARSRFWSKSLRQRVEWFSDKYSESVFGQNNCLWFPVECGKLLCPNCFTEFYRINKKFYYKHINRFRLGAITTTLKTTKPTSAKTADAADWLNSYAVFHGDRMPDKNVVFLPYKTRKIDIYRMYKDEWAGKHQEHVSRSSFYSIWRLQFPNLKIKKTNCFSKCNICTKLQSQIESTRNTEKHHVLAQFMKAHNSRQRMERHYYKTKREKAKQNPRQFMSLIIDGMDQAKTNLPHFTGRRSNDLDMANLLSTHVQGVINHGLGTFTKYVDIKEWSHDSNMVINTILKELFDSSLKMNGKFPPTLFLQADNCFRENKNKYVLGLCEILVRKDIFKEVELSFLFVGHTHEDIDAGFSKVADLLRRNDATTLPQLIDLIPSTKQLRGIYDVKGWMLPHINSFTQHTKPHHFRFSKDIDNQIIVEYKGTFDRPWKKLQGTILKRIPIGIPNIILPSFIKINVEALEKNIERSRYLFKDHSSHNWWTRYLAFLRNLKSDPSLRARYGKYGAKWLLPLLPVQKNNIPQTSQRNNNIPQTPQPSMVEDDLREIVDRELDEPDIVMQAPAKRTPAAETMSGKRKLTGKKNEQPKKHEKKTRRYKLIGPKTNDSFVMICDRERKKYIWLNLILDLLFCLKYIMYLVIILHTLEMCLFLLEDLWQKVIQQHIGGVCCLVTKTVLKYQNILTQSNFSEATVVTIG